MDPKFDVTKLYHQCTGKDCTLCAWCVNNPISIGWKASFEAPVESCSNNADKSTEIVDKMCILNEKDIEKLDKIEYELSQKQEPIEEPAAYVIMIPQEAAERKPGQKKYGSPKSQEKALEAMSNGVPEKTRNQTKWACSKCMEGVGS